MKILKPIKRWYNGEEYRISEDIIPGMRYRHHWTAKLAHAVVNFLKEHQKVIISAIIVSIITLATEFFRRMF